MTYSDRHKTFLVDFSLSLWLPHCTKLSCRQFGLTKFVMVALLNPWRQAFAGYGKSVRLCSWGYCSISLSSRERSSAPVLKNTGFHHVVVSFFGEDVQRASSRDFSFRSRGIDMQISFTFFTRCFYSPQHSTAFFPGNQIQLSINSRSSSLANLPPDMHPLASNLGYASHSMLLYLKRNLEHKIAQRTDFTTNCHTSLHSHNLTKSLSQPCSKSGASSASDYHHKQKQCYLWTTARKTSNEKKSLK